MLLFHKICTLTVQVKSNTQTLLALYLHLFFVCFGFSINPPKHIRSAMKKIESLNTDISEMEQQVKEVDERNHSLRSKKKDLNEEMEGLRAQVDASQRECRQLLKEQEVNREEEAEFMGNRYKLLLQSQSKIDIMEKLF